MRRRGGEALEINVDGEDVDARRLLRAPRLHEHRARSGGADALLLPRVRGLAAGRERARARPRLSHGAAGAGNRLIHGDSRDVPSALADEIAGVARCVYLDPPYNNRERWTHYDDREGHDRWLAAVEATLVGVW